MIPIIYHRRLRDNVHVCVVCVSDVLPPVPFPVDLLYCLLCFSKSVCVMVHSTINQSINQSNVVLFVPDRLFFWLLVHSFAGWSGPGSGLLVCLFVLFVPRTRIVFY